MDLVIVGLKPDLRLCPTGGTGAIGARLNAGPESFRLGNKNHG